MKKILYLMICCMVAIFTSCSETEIVDTEFANWQERNDAYFETIYSKAKQAIDNGDNTWRIVRGYSKKVGSTNKSDYIVMEQLASGPLSQTVNYTDSVSYIYQGRLIPTESYPEGYIFDTRWTGEYDLQTTKPLNSAVSDFVDGFSTALMAMNPGDRYKVYIPCQLGYGTVDKSTIPAYSCPIFDLTLIKAWKKRK